MPIQPMSRRAFLNAAASTLVTTTSLFPRIALANEALWVPGLEMPPDRDFVSARLILCRDASDSVFIGPENPIDKYGIQKDSTAAALASEDIQSLILSQQGIVIGDIQYSSHAIISVKLGFIDTPEKILTYSDLIKKSDYLAMRGGTSPSEGMKEGDKMLSACFVKSSVTVMDVSGDGQFGEGIGGQCRAESFNLATVHGCKVNAITLPSKDGFVRESFAKYVVTDENIFQQTGVRPGKIWDVSNMKDYKKTLQDKMQQELFAGNMGRPRFV